MATVYQINKGINKPIEFKGLKAQYIFYLGIGLVFLLLLFAGLYTLGVHLFFCVTLIGSLGTMLFTIFYRMSHQFGQYGMLKYIAKRKIPPYLKSSSRKVFTDLKEKEVGHG